MAKGYYRSNQKIKNRQIESMHELNMQIFPINMKGAAGSLVTLVSWLGSWIVSYAFNFLLVWNSYGKPRRTKWYRILVRVLHTSIGINIDSAATSDDDICLCVAWTECRHILHLCKHMWAHSCVCGAASARNQRKNPRGDPSLHELILGVPL
jgi:hypothetical protein